MRTSGISAVIKKVRGGKFKKVDFTGRVGEYHQGREFWQQYGHESWPLPGSEGVVLFAGDVNVAHMVATRDRRYSPAIVEGETVSFTDEGDFLWFKRGNLLHIFSKVKVKVECLEDIEVIAKRITATASENASLTAPMIYLKGEVAGTAEDGASATAYNLKGTLNIDGNINATGNINASGNIMDGAGNTNHHSHP